MPMGPDAWPAPIPHPPDDDWDDGHGEVGQGSVDCRPPTESLHLFALRGPSVAEDESQEAIAWDQEGGGLEFPPTGWDGGGDFESLNRQ